MVANHLASRDTRMALIAAPKKLKPAAVRQAKRNPRMNAANPTRLASAADCCVKACSDEAPLAANCAPTMVVATAAPIE